MRNFALNEMKLLNEMIRLPFKGDAFMHSPIDFSHAHRPFRYQDTPPLASLAPLLN